MPHKTKIKKVDVGEDLDYVSDAAAAILEYTPKGARLLLWGIFLFLIAAGVWAYYGELDTIATGQGKVIPSSQVQVIQNLEGGILSALLVKEGDVVERGQVLLKIDDTRFTSSYQEQQIEYLALLAKSARLHAEAAQMSTLSLPAEVLEQAPDLGAHEVTLFNSRKLEFQAKVKILKQQVSQRRQELRELSSKSKQLSESWRLAKRELTLTRPLRKSGAVSEVEILRLERQVNDLWGARQAVKLSRPRINSTLVEARSKIDELKISVVSEAQKEYNTVNAELARLSESRKTLIDRVKRTEVRSLVHGTIKQIKINTPGGVIKPGMELVEVVPIDDSLLIEARISPRDIAFIHPGQGAIVKFTAYDFAIYGGLDAKVEHISADTIASEVGESFYLIRVRTAQTYLGNTESVGLPIIPGMLAAVDVLTGKKTVLDYLLKPVLRAREKAFTER